MSLFIDFVLLLCYIHPSIHEVPEHVLNRNLIGGRNTVDLLERLGLAFRMDAKVQEKDEVTINAVVPFVHVFPLDINHPLIVRENGDKGKDEVYKKNQNNFERQDNVATLQNGKIRQGVYSQNRRGEKKTRMSNILLITDLHPSALGTTNVGNINDDNGHDGGGGETVMYVGPDSLALIRHLQHTFFSDLLLSCKPRKNSVCLTFRAVFYVSHIVFAMGNQTSIYQNISVAIEPSSRTLYTQGRLGSYSSKPGKFKITFTHLNALSTSILSLLTDFSTISMSLVIK